jgi:hypothetical protein
MGAFEDFLKKQGYVKLDRYGLVLTPDDRILSTRPAVLDDGLGGKIVGWADGDLAAAELETFGAPAKKAPAPKPAAAKPVAANPGVQIAPPARPLPGIAPMATMATLPGISPAIAPIAAPPPAPARMPSATIPPPVPSAQLAMIAAVPPPVTKPSQVAEEPVVEEDEWEWEIAMARARAAGDEVVSAGANAAASFTAPKAPVAPKRTMPMAAVAKPATPVSQLAKGSGPVAAAASSLAAASAASDAMSSWPSTETMHESWEETRESAAPQVLSPAQKNIAVAKTAVRKTPVAVPLFEQPQRSTVIPVPSLPVAASPAEVRPAFKPGQPPPRLASKARSAPQPRTRLARGTERSGQEPAPSEDTVVTATVMPANDDRTSPYVTLPAEIKPAPGFAHTKQVAAKHR